MKQALRPAKPRNLKSLDSTLDNALNTSPLSSPKLASVIAANLCEESVYTACMSSLLSLYYHRPCLNFRMAVSMSTPPPTQSSKQFKPHSPGRFA
jgi:hypothetical protein